MIVLAIDTCLGACAAAVTDGERVLAARSEAMARGHQERLAPLVAEAMAAAGVGFGRLDRIGVTIGPGSFAGLRVGLAFAKGLAAALGIPAVGVGALEALAAAAPQGLTVAAIDARRGQVYAQGFQAGRPLGPPEALSLETASARLAAMAGGPVTLVGSAAAILAEAVPHARAIPDEAADPVAVARLAASRDPGPLAPLYLRAPDARLPAA
jgi:tRNA threonylcarbamoyladenosine biosynthesis protein TsaB